MRVRVILLCGLFFTSCGETAPTPGDGVTVRDSAGISVVESSAPPQSGAGPLQVATATSLTIGEEEGAESLLLHRVRTALRLPDGRIVIANGGSHELRLVDASGMYLRSVGRMGGGPGEFSEFAAPRWDVIDTTGRWLGTSKRPVTLPSIKSDATFCLAAGAIRWAWSAW